MYRKKIVLQKVVTLDCMNYALLILQFRARPISVLAGSLFTGSLVRALETQVAFHSAKNSKKFRNACKWWGNFLELEFFNAINSTENSANPGREMK